MLTVTHCTPWSLAVLCAAGGSACCLLCGGLRDEDQYLLRHSSPALDPDSPCGQHMLLAHLEHQDKEQLQRTLARLENENRSVCFHNFILSPWFYICFSLFTFQQLDQTSIYIQIPTD